MKILFNSKAILGAASFAALMVGASLYAATIFDIQYPIAELGGCTDQASCKAYCSTVDHQQACEDFAAAHGLGQAAEHKQDLEKLASDGGPGQCAENAKDPEASCKAYCDQQANMRECVAYGKDHGLLRGEELTKAEQIIKALDAGAKLPAGCTSRETCQATCEDPKDLDTAKQCFAFGEQAGLLPPGVDKARAEKTFELIAAGKAPFKSIKDFKQCDNPQSEDVLQKCISFATDNGLMSPEDAQIVKETGGKGPGGCMGKDQCEAYCEEHGDECFQFAQAHNMIKPEDKARMEEGAQMLKQSLEKAPPEVKQCLSQQVGDDVLNQVMSGQKPPSPAIGNAMRGCFESVIGSRPPMDGEGDGSSTMRMGYPGGYGSSTGPGEGFHGFPGDDNGAHMPGRENFPMQGGPGMQGDEHGAPPQANFSPEVKACIISKVGQDGLDKIEHPTGGPPDETLGIAIKSCFTQLEGERTGPGGCKTAEECKAYCSDPAHNAECGVPTGSAPPTDSQGSMPPQMMPSHDGDQDMYDGSPQGQYGQPPSGYQYSPDGMMPPPDGTYPSYPPPTGDTGTQTPPPPSSPTGFLLGLKNVAAAIFSFFGGD